MKIDQNITVFAGAQPANAGGTEAAGQNQETAESRKTVFAGNLNQNQTLQDRIAQRRQQAREEAMKVVGDVLAAEHEIDQDMENRRGHVQELKEEKLQLMEEKGERDAHKESLARAFEDGELSQEDYEQELKDMYEHEKAWNQRYSENDSLAKQENAIIRGTRQERLKKDPMVKAQKEAEGILQAARDDIVGMAVEEGKDHIDEEAEKRQEQAEEIKEEREEKEELIEEQKEKREEEEELLEKLPLQEMLTLDNLQTDVQQEVQDIINKMKLVAEDIKGAAVDQTV